MPKTYTEVSPQSPASEDDELQDHHETQSSAPYYDRSLRTRNLCIAGLVFSWACAIFCIAFGAIASTQAWTLSSCSGAGTELLLLAQNFVITICNESLGYIHTISLRWTLQNCGRLDFSSNLRLFQNPYGNGPNAWYSNVIVLVAIISTYGASAVTVQPDYTTGHHCDDYHVYGVAWIVLGCALAAQACIASWAMSNQSEWPTWSSDVMNIATACVHEGYLRRRPGRALLGLKECSEGPRPTLAISSQVSACRSHKQVRRIMFALWIAVGFSSLYTIIVFAYSHPSSDLSDTACWSLVDGTSSCALVLLRLGGMDFPDNQHYTPRTFTWLFLLLCALQTLTTLPLHFAELCINSSRDETTWRQTSATSGQRRTSNALVKFLGSWQSMTLFCLKPFAHWVYSLSFFIEIGWDLNFGPPQVLYVTLVILALAVFGTVMALWRHKGPQPSTFGHLQTLVDLIDQWHEKDQRMFWGDKGPLEGTAPEERQAEIRHAGTHCHRLPFVERTRLYA